MRMSLALLALVAIALAAAIVGPLAFSAHLQAAPAVATDGTGDLVYRSGSYAIRLTEDPCDHEELEMMVGMAEGITPAKAAVVTTGTTRRAGCWAMNGGGSVVVRDYRSGQTDDVLPLDWFTREPAS